uniref:Uncharacterized protein n=1 Tax=Oryza sativa subsp. japonica TaxID=39947 RepID=Q6ZAF3_ORYSJ|nr:hypothetical protein [Oryza sativa Japonica Group]
MSRVVKVGVANLAVTGGRGGGRWCRSGKKAKRGGRKGGSAHAILGERRRERELCLRELDAHGLERPGMRQQGTGGVWTDAATTERGDRPSVVSHARARGKPTGGGENRMVAV